MTILLFIAHHWISFAVGVLLCVGIASNPVMALTLLRKYWQYLLAAVLLWVAYEAGYRSANSACQAKATADSAKQQHEILKQTARARDAETKAADAQAQIGKAYEQGKTDAQAKSVAVVAELRAGTVRLRHEWQGCVRAASATPAAPGLPDADARLREESAGAFVRDGAEADSWITNLQAVIAQYQAQQEAWAKGH